ncbi:hypothetical protein JTB14_011168 [Gonioctena quinquepunctata]|nr:hypothetical protein JTB14_011168 [Gonioctena quinquepunctata]
MKTKIRKKKRTCKALHSVEKGIKGKKKSAQIHKLLMARKKRREESVQEYVLIMREIGSRANIESEVLIQYIIDGIQDDTSNKLVMYGAKIFGEFKEKVKLHRKEVKKQIEEIPRLWMQMLK